MPTSPQPEWLLAAAAIGGTIGGLFSLAGVQLQLRASRAESAAAERAKLRAAVRDLIAIDVAIEAETADMPPVTKLPKTIDRLMPGGDLQQIGSFVGLPHASFLTSRLSTRVLVGSRGHHLVDRLCEVQAELLLIGLPEVMQLAAELDDFRTAFTSSGDRQALATWREQRSRIATELRAACEPAAAPLWRRLLREIDGPTGSRSRAEARERWPSHRSR